MLKNSKVVLFVTLKSWSGRKLLDRTTLLSETGVYLRIDTASYSRRIETQISHTQALEGLCQNLQGARARAHISRIKASTEDISTSSTKSKFM